MIFMIENGMIQYEIATDGEVCKFVAHSGECTKVLPMHFQRRRMHLSAARSTSANVDQDFQSTWLSASYCIPTVSH